MSKDKSPKYCTYAPESRAASRSSPKDVLATSSTNRSLLKTR